MLSPALERLCKRQLAEAVASNTTLPSLAPEVEGRRSFQRKLQDRLRLFLISKGVKWVEGNTGKYPWQQLVYMALGANACVEQVCEIGFNAGHSATVWLSAKPSIKLTAFDTASHEYVLDAARFMTEASEGRMRLIYGRSEDTVPMAVSKGHPLCDVLVIDGGHANATAAADLVNMAALANPAFHILVMDDLYCWPKGCIGPSRAAREAVEGGRVELLQGYQSPDLYHGFAVGRYTPAALAAAQAKAKAG